MKHRGAIYPDKVLSYLKRRDYSFVKEQKMCYYLSYEEEHYQFHVVDRFASFPLYYTIQKGKLHVSEQVDELIPHLPEVRFDPVGYCSAYPMVPFERTDRTPFEGIKRIMPGNYVINDNGRIKEVRYWSFLDLKYRPFEGSLEEAAEELGYLIKQAVRRCYDFAPDAALHLSGGLDSGAIASLLSQISKEKPIRAYALIPEGAPLKDGSYESSYISKYQMYFPNLKVNRLNWEGDEDLLKKSELLLEPNNWYAISKDNEPQIRILEQEKNRGGEFILTGLGGDELASYITHIPNLPLVVNNDWQAKMYFKWIYKKYRKWRYYIHSILNETKYLKDNLNSHKILNFTWDRRYWYTQEFASKSMELFKPPVIWSGITPASFNYRLEILHRTYFTQRSDVWNYVGNHFNISYLHPFLDSDLAEFSARIPNSIIKQNQSRGLIKMALMKDLPKTLLEGLKRPIYYKNLNTNVKGLKLDLQYCFEQLQHLKGTFSATVYNHERMINDIAQEIKLLNELSLKNEKSLRAILFKYENYSEIINRSKYLNYFFQ